LTVRRAAESPFQKFAIRFRGPIEARLASAVPSDSSPLSAAMRAALLSPGKRIRALVALGAGLLFRGPEGPLLDYAASVEAVHAASLVFDDLPCMDDATLRRGSPALHVVHGESTAILAAISLLNRAFEILAVARGVPPAVRARLVRELAWACGEEGSCRGQQADLQSDPRKAGLEDLERIHALKTGALFVAAARGGAIAARASEEEIEAVSRYAKNLGLAFQIIDDLLEDSGQDVTGKKAHGEGHRANFARILGRETARTIAGELTEAAAESISSLGRRSAPLADLAFAVKDRKS
jgi:geranylgeranyl pyrophosphate synthase